jgi:hypothetical protein
MVTLFLRREGVMESKSKMRGYPIHSMLVVFPLGLLVASFIFDLISLSIDEMKWSRISIWMIAGQGCEDAEGKAETEDNSERQAAELPTHSPPH